MPNFQDLESATNGNFITIERDASSSPPQALRPANEILAEVTRLTHLDNYPLGNGVVSPLEKARSVLMGDFLDDVLSRLSDLVKAYNLLHTEFELRSTSITMFVQEKRRPWVAKLVEANEDEWGDVENVIELCVEGSGASLREAEDEIEQLLQTFGVSPETPGDLQEEVPSTFHGVLGWKLQHLHFVYALALVSSVSNHVVDFDWQIWEEPVDCFQISEDLAFRRHDVGSMAEFLGPVWILASDHVLHSPHYNNANSSNLTGLNHNIHQKVCGEHEKLLLEWEVAEQSLDDNWETGTPAKPRTRPTKISTAKYCNTNESNTTFQISIPVTKLWALWYAKINLVEQGQHPLGEENTEVNTPSKGPRPSIANLGVGTGIILPMTDRLVPNKIGEIVCQWFNLRANEHGNARTLADILDQEDIDDVELYDSYTLLII